MAAIDRRRFLAGAAGATLAGCAPGERVAEERPRPPKEGGIGGTGIVGVLTDFGSIVVNARRIAVDRAPEITDALGARNADALVRGQSLTVEATEDAPGAGLYARRIHITHPLIGPVERVTADGRGLVVAGVAVRLEPGVALEAAPGAAVAVSGLWDGDVVVASRIDPAPTDLVVVSGTLMASGGGAAVHALALAPGAALPAPGGFVTVAGRLSGGALVAERVVEGRFTGAAGPLIALSVEGYLEPVTAAPGFTLSGLGHSFDRDAQLAAFARGRALFEGPYTGDFAVRHGLALPEGTAARRAALPAGLDIAAAPGTRPTR
ncbi:MAG: DUF5666 domain-containing protein [Pseudomonadota bacterium]